MSDNCKTGLNAAIMPGVKMGPNSIAGPGIILEKDLAPGKIIFVKQNCVVKDNVFTLDADKKQEFQQKLLKYIK